MHIEAAFYAVLPTCPGGHRHALAIDVEGSDGPWIFPIGPSVSDLGVQCAPGTPFQRVEARTVPDEMRADAASILEWVRS